MRAWVVDRAGPMATAPLRLLTRPDPVPVPGEIVVEVSVCAVCRTDLHLAEGDLPPRHPLTTPGHEVVGRVVGAGVGANRFSLGERVGVAWLASACGRCRFCARGDENLCVSPEFTGWDRHGGFAERLCIGEAFAYKVPEAFSDAEAAPLLCAGIIGYRALRRAGVRAGCKLGIYGFGASAHLAAQVALHLGATVHVMTRSEQAQRLALSLGCASAQGADDPAPEPLDSAVLFAPAGHLVLPALAALDRGGRLAIAGIHLSDVPSLNYERHLFNERELVSVTANTRRDGEELLRLAAGIPIRPTVTLYPFEHADRALEDLAADRVNGAAVLAIG